MLLNCESFIHADIVSLFVIHAWHPRFHLSGIKHVLNQFFMEKNTKAWWDSTADNVQK